MAVAAYQRLFPRSPRDLSLGDHNPISISSEQLFASKCIVLRHFFMRLCILVSFRKLILFSLFLNNYFLSLPGFLKLQLENIFTACDLSCIPVCRVFTC